MPHTTIARLPRFFNDIKLGHSKDEALQAAILSVASTPAYAAPRYWAAFRLTGDASPLH